MLDTICVFSWIAFANVLLVTDDITLDFPISLLKLFRNVPYCDDSPSYWLFLYDIWVFDLSVWVHTKIFLSQWEFSHLLLKMFCMFYDDDDDDDGISINFFGGG
jgi:hypothetical protein